MFAISMPASDPKALGLARIVARFEAKISPEPNSGCWLWTGTVNARGYGWFAFAPKDNRRAHRVAWELAHGAPGKMLVCHHCDIPTCVNPAHLFLGTDADNVRDMDEKGRRRTVALRGEKSSRATLTEAQVIEIRDLLAGRCHTHWVIASRFGVSQGTIDAIATGRRWGWVGARTRPPLADMISAWAGARW